MLGQIADGFSFCEDHLTAVRVQLMHDNFQKGGFSRPVDAYNGRLFTVFDMKRSVFQDDIGSESFLNILTCQYHGIHFFLKCICVISHNPYYFSTS